MAEETKKRWMSRKLLLTITTALGIVGAMLSGALEVQQGILDVVGLLTAYFFANSVEHHADAKKEAASK